MPRIKRGVAARRRHKKILKMAKGYRGSKSKLFRVAKQQVMKSGQYAYIHRRLKKRDFRKLWIARINAAARINGTTYSRMVHGLKVAGVDINRKMLAELAVKDPVSFTKLAELSKEPGRETMLTALSAVSGLETTIAELTASPEPEAPLIELSGKPEL